jgi:hypothetical protein
MLTLSARFLFHNGDSGFKKSFQINPQMWLALCLRNVWTLKVLQGQSLLVECGNQGKFCQFTTLTNGSYEPYKPAKMAAEYLKAARTTCGSGLTTPTPETTVNRNETTELSYSKVKDALIVATLRRRRSCGIVLIILRPYFAQLSKPSSTPECSPLCIAHSCVILDGERFQVLLRHSISDA